ncbi:MAG TPA: hypothetical protein VER17_17970 [Tepidisphaeraceae bacterium]|nr:hypothetical protein [Tepidisphaeraceae bacterium]
MRFAALLAVVLLSLTLFAPPAPAAARDAFVGAWAVTVTPDDTTGKAGEKEFKDTFTFKGMQFTSEACNKKHGFKSAEYTEDTRGGIAATFKCEAKSDKQGTATWTGTSTGSSIKGELVWKKPDGTELRYSFTGEKKS